MDCVVACGLCSYHLCCSVKVVVLGACVFVCASNGESVEYLRARWLWGLVWAKMPGLNFSPSPSLENRLLQHIDIKN